VDLQWSKLKKRVEQLFREGLQGRVELFSTWYYKGGSPHRGRAVILVDKQEVFEANTDKWIFAKENQDEFERLEFHDALEQYLSLSIEDALMSDNFLIRSLSMIDRRLGKRRLRQIRLEEKDYRLIKIMYKLRCEVERI